jgi:uncharacterized lipoprotein
MADIGLNYKYEQEKNMEKKIFQVVLLAVILSLFFVEGCATPRKRALKSTMSLYEKSYDEVWNAVNDFLLSDLNCSIDSEDKASGRIETGWVHTMDMDGYNKWKITARVKKKKNGVYVEIDKLAQVKKIPRKRVGMYAEERAKHEARNTAEASTWKTLKVDKAEIESFHNQLRIRINKFTYE